MNVLVELGNERSVLAAATSESLDADYALSFHALSAGLREHGVTLRTGRPSGQR